MGRAVKKAASKTAGKAAQGITGKGVATKGKQVRLSVSETVSASVRVSEAVGEKKLPPVRNIQTYADKETRKVFREICKAHLEQACKGAIPHTRLLIKIGKMDEKTISRRRTGKSLSAILMEELSRVKTEVAAATPTEQAGGE